MVFLTMICIADMISAHAVLPEVVWRCVKYEVYDIEEIDSLTYEFVSLGPKGRIRKRVIFQEMDWWPETYNLGFGDVKENNEVDTSVVTNNHDVDRVLATVMMIGIKFLKKYPERTIFLNADTSSRKRLYRMMILKCLQISKGAFHVIGQVNYKWLTFKINVDYDSYSITLKS